MPYGVWAQRRSECAEAWLPRDGLKCGQGALNCDPGGLAPRNNHTLTCYFKNDKLKVFYLDNLIYLLITAVSGFITYRLIGTFSAVLSSHIVKNIIALLICVIVPNTIFLLLYSMNKQTKQYISYGLKSAKRMIGRIQ